MATLTESAALRAIVVVSDDVNCESEPTCRLLRELGHEVVAVHSASEMAELLQSASADLLVLDVPSSQRNGFLNRLSTMPAESRPQNVAVFADSPDASDASRSPEVRVFVRPLHVHGLLNVVRSLEKRLIQRH